MVAEGQALAPLAKPYLDISQAMVATQSSKGPRWEIVYQAAELIV